MHIYIGVNVIRVLSERVTQISIQTRLAIDDYGWPPNQPKDFTPLLLVCHQGQDNIKHSSALAKLQSHDIEHLTSTGYATKGCQLNSHESLKEALDASKMTKQLIDILAPLQESNSPQFVFEGLPGIGKSLLLQEISYKWSTKELLQNFKLVLLFQLHNPALQQALLIDGLLQLFFKEDQKAKAISTACADYLFQNAGKDAVFLFDGLKDGLVASILKRQVLPQCGLVVSSRPHASVKLRQKATVKVNILGFADEERKLFIEQSLKEHSQKVTELTNYLESHLTINSHCYIPFIMVALLYLYNKGTPLARNSVDLYHHFICLTICRHLAKSGYPLENNITDLTDFPAHCSTIIKQLAKLSLEGLHHNKLVFTLEEVRKACPDIAVLPGALNGFGLLQAVQHFGITATKMTFNFLHFSIQEFLAAYHITQLSLSEELTVLREKFWDDMHGNMFFIYTTLTKGQRPAFKRFLQQPTFVQSFKQIFSRGRNSIGISEEILNGQIKCLHLFRCFYEAEGKYICQSIQGAKCFVDKVIDLSCTSLSLIMWSVSLSVFPAHPTRSGRSLSLPHAGSWPSCVTSCFVQ